MRRRNADLVIAAVLAILGLGMAAQAVSYRVITEGGIGPGFMPFVAGLALACFAAWAGAEIVVRERRSRRPAEAQRGVGPAEPGPTQPGPTQPGPTQPGPAQPGPTESRPVVGERRVGLVFALVLGAIVAANVVGFLVAFGLLVFVLLAAVEKEPLWLSAVITVAAVALSYFVFVRMLQVPLPGGVIGLLGS